MSRYALLLSILVICANVFAQTGSQEPPGSQALLEEIRKLREDLHKATAAAQRIQIALYRLQLQNAAVVRTAARVEDANFRVSSLAVEHEQLVREIKDYEERQSRTDDVLERTYLEEPDLPQLRKNLEQVASEEQQWQRKTAEAERDERTERTKLDSLHALLDQLDRALQKVATDESHTISREPPKYVSKK